MKKIKGRNMLIFVGGKAIAGNTDCSIQMETETIEVCPTTQAQWREYITKCSSWKASSSHILVFDTNDGDGNVSMFGTLLGQTVSLIMGTTSDSDNARNPSERYSNGDLYLTGSAIVTSIQIDAKNGSRVSGSFEFQGTGELMMSFKSFVTNDDNLDGGRTAG